MKPSLRRFAAVVVVLLILVGIPLLILAYQAHRTGMTWSQILWRSASRAAGQKTGLEDMDNAILPKGERIDWFVPKPIGEPFEKPPRISHVLACDLDRDGLLDILVCDCQKDQVSWIRQYPRGVFTEHVIATGLVAPAHIEAVDLDGDGDLDLAVAVLGMLFPNNDPIGSVVLLENVGKDANGLPKFVKHVVLEKTARVSDVRAADLNGDGKIDLAVAQFGYDDGQTQWLENLGNWQFKPHLLQSLSGPIHCPIADMNGDGTPDIVDLVSQEWEEIYIFANDGHGNFTPHRIFGSDNEDFGSSGISLCDMNGDGKLDILYTNGDAFDYLPPDPRPWHGVQWLENLGDFKFRVHRIADLPGAYSARAVDFNGDGHLDVIVCSAFNWWDRPTAQSLALLENDGTLRFRMRDIANTPTHILVLDVGDFDGDGRPDLVTGDMHVSKPYDRMERVVLWHNEGSPRPTPTAPKTAPRTAPKTLGTTPSQDAPR